LRPLAALGSLWQFFSPDRPIVADGRPPQAGKKFDARVLKAIADKVRPAALTKELHLAAGAIDLNGEAFAMDALGGHDAKSVRG
jgi:hypothetical protein